MKQTATLPKAFIWRRIHSITGLFFVLYLFEHLLVNSQAALWLGEEGGGFVRMVNGIHELPYLPFIEIFLLGVPIILHTLLGIKYLQTSLSNSKTSDGTTPALPEFSRNHAYTWQRITSWILLFALLFHVVHMRFLEYPASIKVDGRDLYAVRLNEDPELISLANRFDVHLFSENQIPQRWQPITKKYPVKAGEVLAEAPSFGTAELLIVREAFKAPLLIAIYTILVLTACYHGFNGLWTFMISWGITLSQRSQRGMLFLSYALMAIVTFFGLSAIWGS